WTLHEVGGGCSYRQTPRIFQEEKIRLHLLGVPALHRSLLEYPLHRAGHHRALHRNLSHQSISDLKHPVSLFPKSDSQHRRSWVIRTPYWSFEPVHIRPIKEPVAERDLLEWLTRDIQQ